MFNSRLIIYALSASMIFFISLAVPAFGENSGKNSPFPSSKTDKTIVRLEEFLGDYPAESDIKRFQSVLKDVLFRTSNQQKLEHFKGKKISFISESEAAGNALSKNLNIIVKREDLEMAKEAVMEAMAIFDPVLSFSISGSESDTNNRGKYVTIQTKNFKPGIPISIPKAPNKTEAQIIELGWVNQNFGNRITRELFASKEPENGPARTGQGSVAISQILPWGPELNISTATRHQEVFYDNYGHSYDSPFSSSLTIRLDSPIPGLKGFGPYAERDMKIKLNRKDSEWSFWSVKSAINSILSQVNFAYWNVVAAFESLCVVIENRKNVEKQMDIVRKFYNDRLATVYDIFQIEAEYAAACVQEMSILNNLLSSSNDLAVLIEDDPDRVENILYFPYRYESILDETAISYSLENLAATLQQRPEVQMAGIDLERTQISTKFRSNQLRPNIHLSSSITLNQDGSIYGYKSTIESLKNLFKQDNVNQNLSLTYTYPFGNRALKALHRESEEIEQISRLSLRAIKNIITKDVKDAFSMVKTSKARISAAQETLEFAGVAFDRIEQTRKEGESNQFEWILAIQGLVNAKSSLLLARIDHRIAIARLWTAMGTIENRYLELVARNPFDRLRIKELKSNNLLAFFNTAPNIPQNNNHHPLESRD